MTDDYTQAEIVRALQRLETGQARMESKFDSLSAGFVTREVLDIELKGIRQDVEDIKGSRAPWWSVVALIVSGIAVVAPFVIR
jgi:exonuclease VII small subunit